VLAALALVVFGAYDSYLTEFTRFHIVKPRNVIEKPELIEALISTLNLRRFFLVGFQQLPPNFHAEIATSKVFGPRSP